jgi:hypothetical protein
MFLAGIQAKVGLASRLKHSAVTNSGHVIVVYRYPAACCGMVQFQCFAHEITLAEKSVELKPL